MDKLVDAARKFDVKERRREARLHIEYPAYVKILSIPNGAEPSRETIPCLATNISLSGARIAIATYDSLPVGTVARIRMKCGLLKSFTFAGIARNVRKDPRSLISFVGFEITSDSARTISSWRKFIAKHFRADTSLRNIRPRDK